MGEERHLFGERFLVRGRLGAGGMGVVYRAQDTATGNEVAVKTLKRLDAQSLYRFKREFRSLQDLHHPNLISLGELIEESGQWFFTMEMVHGTDFLRWARRQAIQPAAAIDTATAATAATAQTLQTSVHARTIPDRRSSPPIPYDEQRLRAGLAQLAAGLGALHDAGKVHRDIKPSNILVAEDDRVVILDLGLVTERAGSHQSTEAHAVGTAAYMAPEQAASKHVGPGADWYSVGILLYEALTGHVPFAGSPLEIMMDKQHREPPPPQSIVAGVPDDLDALCTELLRFEPSRRPTAAQVLSRLGRAPVMVGAASASRSRLTRSGAFIGREQELSALRAAFEATRGGAPRAVFVAGSSGLGKSELIRRFADELAHVEPDAVVLSGRCYQREAVPYKAFDGVIDALSRYLRRLSPAECNALLPRQVALLPRMFPVLERVEAIADAPAIRARYDHQHELRARVVAALRELLLRIADRVPLVVTIDDWQWADADSQLLLADLLRQPEAPSLLLLASIPTDAEAAQAPLVDDDAIDVHWLRLSALSPDSARELAAQLLSDSGLTAADAAQIAAEADGHPLYIAELAQHRAARPAARTKPLLDEALYARATQLPAPARALLDQIAIAGVPLPLRIVGHSARVESRDLDRCVSMLRVANLIKTSGQRGIDEVEPYHGRVAEAVLAHLDPDARKECHRRLALALESSELSNDRPELLLRHLEAAGKLDKAARYALYAADRAARALAFDRAADMLDRAIRYGSHAANARRVLLIRLSDALANAGRGASAAEAALAAAEGADPVTRLDCRRQAAEQLLTCGHLERGMTSLEALLADIGERIPATPWRSLMWLLWNRAALRLRGLGWERRHEKEIAERDLIRLDVYKAAGLGLSMIDNIRGADFQARNLRLALDTGEPVRLCRALGTEAVFLGSQGGRSQVRARRLVHLMAKMAQDESDPLFPAWGFTADGCVSYFEGRFGRAVDQLGRAITLFRTEAVVGTAWEQNNTRLFQVFALRHLGALSRLRTLFDEYVREAVRRGDRYFETTIRRYCNSALLANDDTDAARRNLEAVHWAPPDDGRFHLQHWYELEARCELALYEDRAAEALAELADRFEALHGSMLPRVQIIRSIAWWLRARLLLSAAAHDGADAPRQRAVAARLIRKLSRERISFAQVWTALLRAALAAQQQRVAQACDHLREAAALAQEHDLGLCAAAARHRLAQLNETGASSSDVEAWASAEGVANPERMFRITAPGFGGARPEPPG